MESEAGLSAAKSEVEVTKAKSEDKELRAKQLLQSVRSKIQSLSRENELIKRQRDSYVARIDEAAIGKNLINNN